MPERPRRPTLAQVAERAGVSVMTASYTFSQPARVSPDTAARVREAARALGYAGPHPGARWLRRGRSGNLGVVMGEPLGYAFEDPSATRFLAGVADGCASAGVGLTLVPVGRVGTDATRVAEAAVDAFVVWSTDDDDPVVDAVVATGLPVVIFAGPERPGVPLIGIDDRAAARAVGGIVFAGARYPAVLGFHRHGTEAAVISDGASAVSLSLPVARRRWQGFSDAWRELDGDPANLRLALCASNRVHQGERLGDALLRSSQPPDAVAAMSDQLALGALGAARSAGRRVPDDLALSGWDDSDAAALADLTSVAQPLREQGLRCADLALGRIPAPRPNEFPWKVVIRGSTRG